VSPSPARPLAERLLMACVALLFLLQPIAGAAGSCTLRAKVFGKSCCCQQAPEAAPKPSCCSKHDAPAQKPAHKRCGCELSAPPLVPPSGAAELPNFLGELARALEIPIDLGHNFELAHTPARAHAPPGFGSCFHARLDAGMSRALAFERTLRC
jgi:hypothetical protein